MNRNFPDIPAVRHRASGGMTLEKLAALLGASLHAGADMAAAFPEIPAGLAGGALGALTAGKNRLGAGLAGAGLGAAAGHAWRRRDLLADETGRLAARAGRPATEALAARLAAEIREASARVESAVGGASERLSSEGMPVRIQTADGGRPGVLTRMALP